VSSSDCLFCRIASGEIPAAVVHQDEQLMAFRDISPQAPVHVLIIPRAHLASLDAADDDQRDLLGSLLLAARDVARAEGIAEGGYRTVMNVGDDGGQSVHHVHLHVLGGRALAWPPG
jgi:histidine triad (HIT) family protein